ncbi:hypothetical protein KNE206_53530 [Kitasatospora sp. NE20-6]|uniref:hypothetical protein n=1 Tax=Kitasatospora sp. NE20-6 TaxID=2859066 RepID=UPI0034DBCA3B
MLSTITFAVDPVLGLVAAAVDRRSRQWLEQAGLVRDDASGLHRLRRDTAEPTGRRIISNATGLLNSVGYDVLRLYSETEQRQAAAHPSAGPAVTREPGTIWVHHVGSDIVAGRLVVHAALNEADGPVRLLADYPAYGRAAVLSTEGGGLYGIAEFGDLAAAVAAFGHSLAPQFPAREPRTASAAAITSRAFTLGPVSVTRTQDTATPQVTAVHPAARTR